MIICVCNNVSDKEIKSEIERGTVDINTLKLNLKMNNECGHCQDIILALIEDKHSKQEGQL